MDSLRLSARWGWSPSARQIRLTDAWLTPAARAIERVDQRAAPGGSGNPCPSALAAVQAVVAPLGLPMSQIRIQPGPFQCGVLWPGVQSPVVCFGPAIVPGASMHGWVAFVESTKVAAVGLYRTPPQGSTPAGPWKASVVAFTVPPDGWLMPG